MQKLLEVMRRLRGPGGCPWDHKQTHDSLRPYLLEEAAEAVDAIGSGNVTAMTEELGDVLLQVAFHAVIAEEAGGFDYDDIERTIVEKLIRRHPHVFGDVQVEGAEEVVSNWRAIKAAEKEGEPPAAERVPRGLPALMRAYELGKELEWEALSTEDVRAMLEEEAEPDIGRLLLAVVDLARSQGLNPELALREAADARAGGTAAG